MAGVFTVWHTFTYELNTLTSNAAANKMEIIYVTASSLLPCEQSCASAKLSKSPGTGSDFCLGIPVCCQRVYDCALSSDLCGRVCHCKVKGWTQVMQCTATHSIDYSLAYSRRKSFLQYTSFIFMLLNVEQRSCTTRSLLTCGFIEVLKYQEPEKAIDGYGMLARLNRLLWQSSPCKAMLSSEYCLNATML